MRKSVENAFDQNGDLRPDDVFDNDALAVDDLVSGMRMSMIMLAMIMVLMLMARVKVPPSQKLQDDT